MAVLILEAAEAAQRAADQNAALLALEPRLPTPEIVAQAVNMVRSNPDAKPSPLALRGPLSSPETIAEALRSLRSELNTPSFSRMLQVGLSGLLAEFLGPSPSRAPTSYDFDAARVTVNPVDGTLLVVTPEIHLTPSIVVRAWQDDTLIAVALCTTHSTAVPLVRVRNSALLPDRVEVETPPRVVSGQRAGEVAAEARYAETYDPPLAPLLWELAAESWLAARSPVRAAAAFDRACMTARTPAERSRYGQLSRNLCDTRPPNLQVERLWPWWVAEALGKEAFDPGTLGLVGPITASSTGDPGFGLSRSHARSTSRPSILASGAVARRRGRRSTRPSASWPLPGRG